MISYEASVIRVSDECDGAVVSRRSKVLAAESTLLCGIQNDGIVVLTVTFEGRSNFASHPLEGSRLKCPWKT